MRDILPDIWITTDVENSIFLDRLEGIADATGQFRSEQKSAQGFGRGRYLHLYPLERSTHAGLGIQLIAYENEGRRVRVEMRAHRWTPDPPTYDVYVRAAKELIDPLLHTYNRSYHTRRRLGVQSKQSTDPSIPATVKPYFNSFVGCANMGMLHPNDWDRFYRFIRVCHKKRVGLIESDIARLLTQAGFDEEYARQLGNVYDHGRRLLQVWI
jgi:hypothetical protein